MRRLFFLNALPFCAAERAFLLCSARKKAARPVVYTQGGPLCYSGIIPSVEDQAFFGSASAEGKMILLTKKNTTMEMPPLSTVVPML